MLIATYQRDLLLPPLIKHLTSSPPPSLRQILIIWQNVDSPLPDFLSPSALDEYSTSGVAVSVRKSWKNSMNERFRPILDWGQDIQTKSVMIMDDDVVLRKEALEWGYKQFVEANRFGPGRIVGFSPRDFERGAPNREGEGDGDGDRANDEWRYITKPRSTYSMILSNAAFLKREWLQQYWRDSEEMRSLRTHVDSVFNCDDILINFLVSNLTHSPPLLLQPSTPLRTIPTEGGLWNRVVRETDQAQEPPSASAKATGSASSKVPDTIVTSPARPEHFATRKECLSHYFSHFSRFAAAPEADLAADERERGHYPLVKTRTSISQDVEDHSRWMFDNEMWETVTWTRPDEAHPGGQDSDDLSAEEEAMLEQGDYDSFLEGLSDEEVEELMQSLDDMMEEEAQTLSEDPRLTGDLVEPVREPARRSHEEL